MYKCYSKSGKELFFKDHVDYKEALAAGATINSPKLTKTEPKQGK